MDTDAELIDAARRKDVQALARIFDLYSTALYRYVFRMCKSQTMADAIVGDVFAKLVEHLEAGKGPKTNLRSYLFETAYHIFVDELRYARHRVPLEAADDFHSDGFSTCLAVERHLLEQAIQRAIQEDLTEDQRLILVLRFMEGCNLQETAAITGKSVLNVKVTQHRAIAILRKVFTTREAKSMVLPTAI
jgi:RNA polymerase sigma-70 factor (ECF subfamily)